MADAVIVHDEADRKCYDDKCDYDDPHDHGFACGPFCPCAKGMQAAKWAHFEKEVEL